MLKRKFEETSLPSEGQGKADEAASSGSNSNSSGEGSSGMAAANGHSESDDSNCSAGSTDALAPEAAASSCGPTPAKRMKKKVNFKGVTVYYFPRRQGFTCVPSEGGSTLGMTEKHSLQKDFSLTDYLKEQKRIHRAILAEQRRQGKMFPSPLLCTTPPGQPIGAEDDVSSGSESDSEYDDYYFLQPLPIRQRRVLLRTSGVKKIDNEEKDDCRNIRVSRNVCGCDCKVFCDPATCSCSAAGIQCQVDRLSFPCGCTKDGCGNPSGRIEFNPIRVRTHFIHTLMRLELERKDSESGQMGFSGDASFSSDSSDHVDVVGTSGDGEEEEEVNSEAKADSETSHETEVDSGEEAKSSSSPSVSENSLSNCVKNHLKSRLKAKTPEPIDLNLFNSNERGSCRDCQNTDMCNVMMHDVKFSMVSHQRQQQQMPPPTRVIPLTPGAGPPAYPNGPPRSLLTPQGIHHLGGVGISLLHPAPPHNPVSGSLQQGQATHTTQHMLLFNDGEEEVYTAENTTSMYFDNDDSSYSELSETNSPSLEALDNRPFAGIGHHRGVTTAPPTTAMFSPNPLQNGSCPLQSSMLNPGCVRRLSLPPPRPPSSNTDGSTTVPGVLSHPPTGPGLFPTSTSLSPPSLYPNGSLPLTQTTGLGSSGSSLISVRGSNPLPSDVSSSVPQLGIGTMDMAASYSNRLIHNFEPSHPKIPPHTDPAQASNLHSSCEVSQQSSCYVSTNSAAKEYCSVSANSQESSSIFASSQQTSNAAVPVYNGQSESYASTACSVSQGTFPESPSTPTTIGHDSSAGVIGSLASFETGLPSSPLSWTAPLVSPTLRECFGIRTANPSSQQQPASSSSLINPNTTDEATVISSSPGSATTAAGTTTTYATMTTTTRDQLATHCPGISSHMERGQGKAETADSSSPGYPDFELMRNGSEPVGLGYTAYPVPQEEGRDSTAPTSISTSVESSAQGSTIVPNTDSGLVESLKHNEAAAEKEDATSTTSLPSVSTKCTIPSLKVAKENPASPLVSSSDQSSVNSVNKPNTSSVESSSQVSFETTFDSSSITSTNVDKCPEKLKAGSVCTISKSDCDEKEDFQKSCSQWSSESSRKDAPCDADNEVVPDMMDVERNPSEMPSSLPSSTTQSSSSSSSSSPTGEEDKETVRENFGEIIKESIVEMVLA